MKTEGYSPHPTEVTESDNKSVFFKKLMTNPNIANLPNHLKQFIVDQNYVAYAPVDHSVWRYVLRQNHRFLIDHAHEIYFEGLEKTGLKVEGIPSIQEMNDILAKIGWAAVSVDGFIPPSAFMEFQAHRVLVIAADMRQINHIEYTPSPDIIHEAAGHAPVIADAEYAEYLRRFGAIGAKAMSSKKDFELYEAIRKLSILKEAHDADPQEIETAEKDVLYQQKNLGEPSEMAKLSRLHWWTVEYGLIGSLENPKIYGAGLLSSIGEAASCLSPIIKKIPYDITAADYPFDITTMQPHLFVTPDFTHLINVLEQFADTMAFRQGGLEGLNKAVECKNTSTAVFSSGLQVSGMITEVLSDNNEPEYIKTNGKSNLSYNDKELPGHGVDVHNDGIQAPVGKLKTTTSPLEDMTESDLYDHNIELNQQVVLEFESGVLVKGILEEIKKENNKIILLIFNNCQVTYKDRTLYNKTNGKYVMPVGRSIVSVFSGAADKDAYEQPSTVSKTRVIKYNFDEKGKQLNSLYQKIRDVRANKEDLLVIPEVWGKLRDHHSEDWLLPVEILEIIRSDSNYPEIELEIKKYLEDKAKDEPELEKLISDGIYLAYNPTKYKKTWKN